jgi:hypothetical protein
MAEEGILLKEGQRAWSLGTAVKLDLPGTFPGTGDRRANVESSLESCRLADAPVPAVHAILPLY